MTRKPELPSQPESDDNVNASEPAENHTYEMKEFIPIETDIYEVYQDSASQSEIKLSHQVIEDINLMHHRLIHCESNKLDVLLQVAGLDITEDLRGAVLNGMDLTGSDLAMAVLDGADLSYTILKDAVLSSSLQNANLSHADLEGALLRGSNLYNANFDHANLYGANLTGSYLQKATFRRAHLRRAVMTGLI